MLETYNRTNRQGIGEVVSPEQVVLRLLCFHAHKVRALAMLDDLGEAYRALHDSVLPALATAASIVGLDLDAFEMIKTLRKDAAGTVHAIAEARQRAEDTRNHAWNFRGLYGMIDRLDACRQREPASLTAQDVQQLIEGLAESPRLLSGITLACRHWAPTGPLPAKTLTVHAGSGVPPHNGRSAVPPRESADPVDVPPPHGRRATPNFWQANPDGPEGKYNALCARRREAFAAHLATMPPDLALTAWAAGMAERHGPTVTIWAHQVDWITALMIALYGEAVEHWPAAFSMDDIRRAVKWAEKDDWPTGTTKPG